MTGIAILIGALVGFYAGYMHGRTNSECVLRNLLDTCELNLDEIEPPTLRRRVIARGLTLKEAQRHCSDPETSSATAKGRAGRDRTRKFGAWFDGYEEEGR